MSKAFKGKTCVYCGTPNGAETGDHVFARGLFPRDARANLPKVPACEPCNRIKSELEHYLATVLPFASQHPLASNLLEHEVPNRLSRNAKLHRQISAGHGYIEMPEDGAVSPRLTIPFDGKALAVLFRMVLRGLVAFHWNVVIPQNYFVGAGVLNRAGDEFMRQMFTMTTNQRVAVNLGDGLVLYEGVQGVDNPAITIWRFQLYGGTQFGGDPDAPGVVSSDIWALSAPEAMPQLFNAA